jgi:hypothetical protein
MAVVTVAAPIFAEPSEQHEPLRVAKEGSVLRFIDQTAEWTHVEFQDPESGRRMGFIQTRFIRLQNRELPPQDLSISDAVPAPRAPSLRTNTRPTETPATMFRNAQLRQQQGDKTKDAYVTLGFESNQFVVQEVTPNGKSGGVLKTLDYRDVKAAEYTFGKSPRVAAAILVSPFFLASSSKSHWLTIKSQNDYALLRLDKSNYKLVIAELEKRTGIRVEDVGENK